MERRLNHKLGTTDPSLATVGCGQFEPVEPVLTNALLVTEVNRLRRGWQCCKALGGGVEGAREGRHRVDRIIRVYAIRRRWKQQRDLFATTMRCKRG